jgi:hypothetical protein
VSDADEQAIHEAIDLALNELAERLGGGVDAGGPVVNITQIKERGDLGVLLTDAQDRVLGRVWIAFGGAVDGGLLAGGPASFDPSQRFDAGGDVRVRAEVCSEIIDPPLTVDEWVSRLDAN